MTKSSIPTLRVLPDYRMANQLIESCIRDCAASVGHLEILEAGCGRQWPFALDDIQFRLTGVDLDRDALRVRMDQVADLDEGIVGDLRDVKLPPQAFDVVYSSFVLEHIEEASRVLENFVDWLKPGGILILKVPDSEAVYGFLAKNTPFWFHVFYYRFVVGMRNAGKPGFGPYPTFYSPILSRRAMHLFAQENDLHMVAEAGLPAGPRWQRVISKGVSLLSFGALAGSHVNLVYVLRKTVSS